MPANNRLWEDFARQRCSRLVMYTNDRVCALGRGNQREQGPRHRDNAAFSEGLGVLPVVANGNL